VKWTVRWQAVLAACVASAALNGLLVGSVLSWKHGKEIAELKLAHREQMVKGWQAAHRVNERVTEQFNEDLAVIANRPMPRPVLVCRTGGTVLPGAAAGTGAETPGGLPPEARGEVGRDLGPYIAGEADRADRCAAQLNRLIDWINTVRRPDA
jgi:hypothetical protein